MIDHPCDRKALSLKAIDAFEDIANGNTRWHAPKAINLLLRNGLIMRRGICRRKPRGETTGFEAGQWILTPDAWALWTEYERQRKAAYVETEELQPAASATITAKERA